MAKGTADVQYSHMHPPCTPPGMMSRNRELFHSDMQEKQPPELQIEVQIEQKVTQRIPLDIQREAASPQKYQTAARMTKESRAGALWSTLRSLQRGSKSFSW